MRPTICLINQKGGCGKSSTTFHLAGAYAAQGLKVLLIDMDPQGSLSQGFFGSSNVEELPLDATVASLLVEDQLLNHDHLVHETAIEGISLVPANQWLSAFNTPAPTACGMQQLALREFVEGKVEFDLILIDCPPNLYRCSWTAMVASHWVVIPVPPEDFGTQGLRAVHQAIDEARQLNPELQLLGHLVTRHDRRLVVHRAYEQRLRNLYGSQVLETVIPEASAFKVALACRQPVETAQSHSRAADLTRILAREIFDRIAMKNGRRRVA